MGRQDEDEESPSTSSKQKHPSSSSSSRRSTLSRENSKSKRRQRGRRRGTNSCSTNKKKENVGMPSYFPLLLATVALAPLSVVFVLQAGMMLMNLSSPVGTSISMESTVAQQQQQQALAAAATSANIAAADSSLKHAYAFLLAGCHPDKPNCSNQVYNLAVSAYLLKHVSQTKADVVVLVRMASSTQAMTLPKSLQRVLEAVGVQIRYIPKLDALIHNNNNSHKSQKDKLSVQHAIMLDRFRILQLDQYDRVTYIDTKTILPLCPLMDSILTSNNDNNNNISKHLQENLILAGEQTPALASLFMVRPRSQDFTALVDLVEQHQNDHPDAQDVLAHQQHLQKQLKSNNHNHNNQNTPTTTDFENTKAQFINPTTGWGHTFHPPQDRWTSYNPWKGGSQWDFDDAEGVQGLLFHYVKYMRRRVTVVHQNLIHHWGVVVKEVEEESHSLSSSRTSRDEDEDDHDGEEGDSTATPLVQPLDSTSAQDLFGSGCFPTSPFSQAPTLSKHIQSMQSSSWTSALSSSSSSLLSSGKIFAPYGDFVFWNHLAPWKNLGTQEGMVKGLEEVELEQVQGVEQLWYWALSRVKLLVEKEGGGGSSWGSSSVDSEEASS